MSDKQTTQSPPPKKLSDLLLMAVDDAQACAKDPRYDLRMSVWHAGSGTDSATCKVCMAGAIMARHLGVKPTQHAEPDDFGGEWASALEAVNDMRCADFWNAQEYTGEPMPSVSSQEYGALMEACYIVRDGYQRANRRASWRDYRKAADRLRKAGL